MLQAAEGWQAGHGVNVAGSGERTQDRGRPGCWSRRSCIQLGGSLPGPSVRVLPRKPEGSLGCAGVKPEKPAPRTRDERVWSPGLFYLHVVCRPPRPEIGKPFPGGSAVKISSIIEETKLPSLGRGRSPEKGNGNPLQYPCLENPMDRGAGG